MRCTVRWGMVKKLVVLVNYFSADCFLNSIGVIAVCFLKNFPKLAGSEKFSW